MEFDVLIDTLFTDINKDSDIAPTGNEFVLSLINDFEDGDWRYTKFQNFIWDNIAETCLSLRERNSLIDQSHSKLVASAKNLRLTDSIDDIGKGSEIAEIVLYGIMKHHFSALSVVPKIFYKQNAQDNAKGADSVHIVTDGNDFSIWFGEAKFYTSIENSRLPEIITSVKNSLATGKLKKENSIITNVSDLDELPIKDDLINEIKQCLSNKISIDSIKPKIHIPILLLHECDITKATSQISQEYKENITAYHTERATAYFKKQIEKLSEINLYAEIKFHLILFPVQSKSKIVQRFVENVSHYKEQ